MYDNIFLKASCILEGIIRWHPFADGNKRTSLVATIFYLNQNGHGFALALNAVRYTITIAKNEKIDKYT